LNFDDKPNLRDRFRGSFVGAAVGDALGFITEFVRDKSELREQTGQAALTNLVPWLRRTRFRGKYTIKLPLPAGAYSDDTQLTLAIARAIRADRSFDVESFAQCELPLWIHYRLGAGVGTTLAAENLARGRAKWYDNFYESSRSKYVNGGGNGAAMRILPLALVNYDDQMLLYRDVWRSTITTHGHLRALVGSLLMADSIALLLKNPSGKIAWLEALIESCSRYYPNLADILQEVPEYSRWQKQWEEKSHLHFSDELQSVRDETVKQLEFVKESLLKKTPVGTVLSRLGCYDRQTKGAGNSTVVAAAFFMCRAERFSEAVLSVVNEFGIDTDTIAYCVGAMFGVYYGSESIPLDLGEGILDLDYILKTADWCYDVHQGSAVENSAFIYQNCDGPSFASSIASMLESVPQSGAIVSFPVFGKGRVESDVDLTPDWRTTHVHFLRFLLEQGQTFFLQITRPVPLEISDAQSVVSSLAALDGFKTRVEASGFDGQVIAETIRDMKFRLRDKALFNAFSTWLWAAMPDKRGR